MPNNYETTGTIDENILFRRILWRIMPIIIAIYFVAIVDKSNTGFAKLQMISDLGMTEKIFGFGSSLFFIGLLLFEIPSSLLAKKFGLRIWVTRILMTWALITWGMIFVTEANLFFILRFLLGVAEAGLYPGILFFIACWFPNKFRAQAIGLMTLGSALGNGFGALLSGSLLSMEGILGLHGWQWLFLVTGALPVFIAVIVWRYLPSRIEDADFLSASEQDYVRRAVAKDAPVETKNAPILAVLWDFRVIALSFGFVVVLTALLGVIYWLPTVVSEFNVSNSMNGFLNLLPWICVAIALITIPPHLSSTRRVNLGAMIFGFVGAAFFAASIVVDQNWLRLATIVFATPCISLLLTCFWTYPGKYFSGTRAAAAIAVIATYGNLGGFFAQNLMPWASDLMGSVSGGMVVPVACLATVGVAGLIMSLSSTK